LNDHGATVTPPARRSQHPWAATNFNDEEKCRISDLDPLEYFLDIKLGRQQYRLGGPVSETMISAGFSGGGRTFAQLFTQGREAG